jgi:adenine-specific DNA-methyltransferase
MEMSDVRLIEGDCLEVMATLAESSVALIVADVPYHKVKMDQAWDRQWKTDDAYLDWIGRLCGAFRRVLRPNGSLYLFASPRLAARVECKVGETFAVLNQVVWVKPDPSSTINYGAGNGGRMCKESMRAYYPNTERIIFAEQFGADSTARGEAGYDAACEELRGFVFEPLRAYLDGERKRAGVPHRDVIMHLGMGGHDTHFFSQIQWKLPLSHQYEAMRQLFNIRGGGDYLRREYEDLRREYEDLRREYEDLRRPFSVDASVPYTDVWDFATVPSRPGKHPCQKPSALYEHIVRASSRPGDTVLDPFAGSGVTAEVCRSLGRPAILIEQDPAWCRRIEARLSSPTDTLPLFPLPAARTA